MAQPNRNLVLDLGGQPFKGAWFGSVAELVAHIESFIDSYNENACPFVWTKRLSTKSVSSHVSRFSDPGY